MQISRIKHEKKKKKNLFQLSGYNTLEAIRSVKLIQQNNIRAKAQESKTCTNNSIY